MYTLDPIPEDAEDVLPPSPENIAQSLLNELSAAWRAGDAAAYAALFTERAECSLRAGAVARGRTQVRDAHAFAFSGTHAGSALEDVRVLAASREGALIGAAATRTVVRAGGAARSVHKLALTLALEPDGKWRVARFVATKEGEGGASRWDAAPWDGRAALAFALALGAAAAVAAALAASLWRRAK